MHIKQIKS